MVAETCHIYKVNMSIHKFYLRITMYIMNIFVHLLHELSTWWNSRGNLAVSNYKLARNHSQKCPTSSPPQQEAWMLAYLIAYQLIQVRASKWRSSNALRSIARRSHYVNSSGPTKTLQRYSGWRWHVQSEGLCNICDCAKAYGASRSWHKKKSVPSSVQLFLKERIYTRTLPKRSCIPLFMRVQRICFSFLPPTRRIGMGLTTRENDIYFA